MLVLTRRAGEEILMGSAISVTVVAVKGGSVRLGITAPATVRVDRKEVNERRPGAGLQGSSTRRHRWGGHRANRTGGRPGSGSLRETVGRRHGGLVPPGMPLELTVGIDHPYLPGLGLVLAGLATGAAPR